MALPVLALVGPTAAGKSAVALHLARQQHGEIVVADSRQLYRGLLIGTSQPTAAQRRLVPHHLVGCVDPQTRFSVGAFTKQAGRIIQEIQARGHHPIIVGGTGLYIRALLQGIAPLPPQDPELRCQLTEEARAVGSSELHRRLAEVDAAAAERIHPHNLHRVIRALEVFQLTGKPLSWWQRTSTSAPSFAVSHALVGLRWERHALAARIAARTRWMLSHGMIEETQALLDQGVPPEAPAFEGVGFRQIIAYLHGGLPRDALEPTIVRETVQYAKRQMTWFRKERGIRWVDAHEPFDAQRMAEAVLGNVLPPMIACYLRPGGERSWG